MWGEAMMAQGYKLRLGDGTTFAVDEKGLLNHTYQFLGVDTYKQTSTEPIPTGDVTVKMLFEIDEPKPGSGGNVTLWANDKQIGEGTMPNTVSLIFTTYAGMDIGRDNGGVVDLAVTVTPEGVDRREMTAVSRARE